LKIGRCPKNPIVWPDKCAWRMSNAYNPAARSRTACSGSIMIAVIPALAWQRFRWMSWWNTSLKAVKKRGDLKSRLEYKSVRSIKKYG
jgi:hypothetical protein